MSFVMNGAAAAPAPVEARPAPCVPTRVSDRYTVSVMASGPLVEAAQRLRYRVFHDEMGADLDGPVGRDIDRFDDYCDHLVVTETASSEVVGTYRMMPPEGAAGCGGWYSATEFNVENLLALRPWTVEVGRSCVHPDHRNGTVIGLLWAGLYRYTTLNRLKYLIGCASVPLEDGGTTLATTWHHVAANHLAPESLRVTPNLRYPGPIPTIDAADVAPRDIPPLVKGYLRVGAWVCGEPSWDPAFNTADLFILSPLDRVPDRYITRFLAA